MLYFKEYLTSIKGGPPEQHDAISTFLLIIGAVFAGYTAVNFPPELLELSSYPLGQFFIFMILGLGLYKKVNKIFIIYDSIIYVIILQLMLYLSKLYYKKREEKRSYNLLK